MNISSLTFWSTLFGWSAVTLTGLAALAGLLAWYFSVQLTAVKDEADLKFKTESSTTIALAEARSEDAKEKAARAGEGTAKALAEAAAANERAGKLEVEAAHQRDRAARAERDLVEVQNRIRPRRITDAQRTQLVQVLMQSPKGAVRIDVVLGDGEALIFARQIKEILTASGWTNVHLSQSVYTGSPVGLSIIVRDGSNVPLFAAALMEAFTSVGLIVHASHNEALPEETVKILVGMKPS
jgi:hypothetical protein